MENTKFNSLDYMGKITALNRLYDSMNQKLFNGKLEKANVDIVNLDNTNLFPAEYEHAVAVFEPRNIAVDSEGNVKCVPKILFSADILYSAALEHKTDDVFPDAMLLAMVSAFCYFSYFKSVEFLSDALKEVTEISNKTDIAKALFEEVMK